MNEAQTVSQTYRYEPAGGDGAIGLIRVRGTKIAQIDRETGKIDHWRSAPVPRAQEFTDIEIHHCDGSVCFDLPTQLGEPNVPYRKDDCAGAFGFK
ncbi:MAG: hypothetical protein ACX930_04125 [Erythrobacter sp.]